MASNDKETIDNSPEMIRARESYFKTKREIYDLIASGQKNLFNLTQTEIDILLQKPRALILFTKELNPRQGDNFITEW